MIHDTCAREIDSRDSVEPNAASATKKDDNKETVAKDQPKTQELYRFRTIC